MIAALTLALSAPRVFGSFLLPLLQLAFYLACVLTVWMYLRNQTRFRISTDEAGIRNEIDIAADLGAEVFVVDAGWYGPDPNRWWNNVGDWQAGSWLPNDLYPIIDHAHNKGMLFGLWVEIESIGILRNPVIEEELS